MATILERLKAQKLGLKKYVPVTPSEMIALAEQAEKGHRILSLMTLSRHLRRTGLPGGGFVDGRVVRAREEAEALLDSYIAEFGFDQT